MTKQHFEWVAKRMTQYHAEDMLSAETVVEIFIEFFEHFNSHFSPSHFMMELQKQYKENSNV